MNTLNKEVVLVAYCDDRERPFLEKPPEEQLRGCGAIIVVVEYFDIIDRILADGHNTTILLANYALPRNEKDSIDRQYWDHLINIARRKRLQGVGILTDNPRLCQPYVKNEKGLSIVVSKSCYNFNIRDWAALLAEVRREIRRRKKGENAAKNIRPKAASPLPPPKKNEGR